MIKQHRIVNELLKEEIAGMHGLQVRPSPFPHSVPPRVLTLVPSAAQDQGGLTSTSSFPLYLLYFSSVATIAFLTPAHHRLDCLALTARSLSLTLARVARVILSLPRRPKPLYLFPHFSTLRFSAKHARVRTGSEKGKDGSAGREKATRRGREIGRRHTKRGRERQIRWKRPGARYERERVECERESEEECKRVRRRGRVGCEGLRATEGRNGRGKGEIKNTTRTKRRRRRGWDDYKRRHTKRRIEKGGVG